MLENEFEVPPVGPSWPSDALGKLRLQLMYNSIALDYRLRNYKDNRN